MPDNFTPITPMKFFTQTVIPTTFDESLTYYELLTKMTGKINELVEIVNYQGEGIYGYIDEQLAKFKEEWEAELQQVVASMNDTINENNVQLNGRIDTLTQTLTKQQSDYEKEINQKILTMQAELDANYAKLITIIHDTDETNREWTENLLQKFEESLPDTFPPVVDPTDGKTEDIQTVINHIWNSMRENALTAQEYDALLLTAEGYDNYELTAEQYDRAGKLLLSPAN